MATYYHGAPEMQPDGLQTLYLMNPTYVSGYTDSAGANAAPAVHQTSMFFLNSHLNTLNSIPQQQQQPHQQQHFVGIPLHTPNEQNRPPPIQATAHYGLWAPPPSAISPGPGRQQGLSLSLSSQQQQQKAPFGPYRAEQQQQEMTAAVSGDEAKTSGGGVGLQSVLMGSKYLRAAQQLLDEVVNVGKGRSEAAASTKGNDSSSKSAMKGGGGKELEGERSDGSAGKKAADLSTAEKQELQMKKAKLVNMLDEVEQRYRQYHQQMQIVVSSFEAVAGFGSARTYTALALQTISKQFRCLRDAISGQIRATSKSMGEEDCGLGGAGRSKSSVGSRLRFVDHHLRQQRALQQLGMIQHNAWRPQRGLPERAVSVLRAWLFEHFLHPYPKDSDKHMLAKQTGLTRSQVSNWFINARVRLWKPMVEEMYLEETKEQEQNNGNNNNNNNNNNNGEDNKASKSEVSEQSASKSTSQQAISSTPSRTEQNDLKPPRQQQMPVHSSGFGMFDSRNDHESSMMQQRLKKPRSDEPPSVHQNAMRNHMGMEMKSDELSNRELLMKFMDQGAGFGAYPIAEMGRFDHHNQFAPRFGGNGVSLTLGLPHCETLSLSGSQQPSYLSNESMQLGRRLELSSEENHNYFSLDNSNSSSHHNGNNPSASHPPNIAYDRINIQNRKRFAAQLLPDFVA